MTDELTIEGKQYISSKRASDLSGYAQDYVGQLARKGFIDAQRIGGLWYVFMESLLKYKEKAESYVPQPPQASFRNESPDTLISFDGKDYVSAARASEITGYHQDYVGQLARSGKILSRQVGNRWYVDREGIMAHKQEKDDLLGAVQSQSVGIKDPEPIPTAYSKKIEAWQPLKYENDSGALLPDLIEPQHEKVKEAPAAVKKSTTIPIRVAEIRQNVSAVATEERKKMVPKRAPLTGNTIFYAALIGLFFVLLITFALSPFSRRSVPGGNDTPITTSEDMQQSAFLILIKRIGDTIEPLLSNELYYSRD
jgi:hypothetical protein